MTPASPLRLSIGLLYLLLAGSLVAAEPLSGTSPLTRPGDAASDMVDGIDRFLLGQIDSSIDRRARFWNRDASSAEAYNASVAANREHLARFIGAFDPRQPFDGLTLVETTSQPALVGRGENFEAYAVSWPVFHGVTGEGLLLKPAIDPPLADVIAVPDADQTPEMLAGLVPGIEPESQFARRLAESGCRVVIPMLIDRADTYSIAAGGARPTNQPHREFVYRPAFEMGRHVIGFEVQKLLALADWFTAQAPAHDASLGVFGYGEGGLLALYAAALDTRFDAAGVSGYFDSRQNVWQEPIYRNVFALLDEFGDAELASLVAPRTLVIENNQAVLVDGPPPPHDGRSGAAPGRLIRPQSEAVAAELARAADLVGKLDPRPPMHLVDEGADAPFGGAQALSLFLESLSSAARPAPLSTPPTHLRASFDPQIRLKRQLDQMIACTQHWLREAEYVRREYWAKADRASRSVEKWQETTQPYRQLFYDEVIGRFDQPLLPANARSRKTYDEPAYTGYEVELDVFPDVFAYGILLLPKDLKPGERRPVVVCQHGLEGRPQDVADPKINNPAYNQYAIRLAERGFITYSPQNPYIFTDRFRTLQRKSNPLRKTLYSTIVPQHQQTVDWLETLPFVDPQRIAFYGLSYGGKTAMRVPSLVTDYCLSICSADFNEWIWKNTSTRSTYSYVGSGEYEIFEFDLGNTFNYAEMAGLIAPRPFMVERGHRDGVAPDEWVAYEFAKVRLLYADLKIPDRATIEFFDGPHTINGVETFNFLHRHLDWPKPQ